jgi:predicted DNA-binding protein with PD1-like motif
MTFRIEITGGELTEELTRELSSRGVKEASIVLIGGVDSFRISNMAADDVLKDIETTYEQPGELTGTGEWRPHIETSPLHLHVTCGIEGDIARAGHLHAAYIETYFVHAYVTPLERAPQPRTGKVFA